MTFVPVVRSGFSEEAAALLRTGGTRTNSLKWAKEKASYREPRPHEGTGGQEE